MRVMVIVKANKDSEAGVLPSEKLLAEIYMEIGRASCRERV